MHLSLYTEILIHYQVQYATNTDANFHLKKINTTKVFSKSRVGFLLTNDKVIDFTAQSRAGRFYFGFILNKSVI